MCRGTGRAHRSVYRGTGRGHVPVQGRKRGRSAGDRPLPVPGTVSPYWGRVLFRELSSARRLDHARRGEITNCHPSRSGRPCRVIPGGGVPRTALSGNRGPRTEDRGPRTEDRGPRTEDRGPRTEDRGPRTEDRGPRTENRGPRTEDRGPRTEDREPRTENRGPRTEDREPRTENRGPRTEDRGPSTAVASCDDHKNAAYVISQLLKKNIFCVTPITFGSAQSIVG